MASSNHGVDFEEGEFFSFSKRNYVIVTGHGRSGSNLILDMLDCHEATFCRNESNKLNFSKLSRLPTPLLAEDLDSDFPSQFSDALEEASKSNGARDRIRHSHKSYARGRALGALSGAAMGRRRFRRLRSALTSKRETEFWPVSNICTSSEDLKKSLPVFKMLLCSSWISASHKIHAGQHAIHIIRNPKGFVKSWYNRYVMMSGGGPEKVFKDNLSSIDDILEFFGRKRGRYKVFSIDALLETELWRWRFFNEALFGDLNGSPRYIMVSYDDAETSATSTASELFNFSGLDFEKRHAARVASLKNKIFRSSHQFEIDPQRVESAMDFVLEGCSLPSRTWAAKSG